MSYQIITNSRPGLPVPLDGQDIHPSWCSCSDCCLNRRRSLRLDFTVIALGVICALIAAATLWLLGGAK